MTATFDRETWKFLDALARDNTKATFDAARATYQEQVVAPSAAFVEAMATLLPERVHPDLHGEAKVGRSLFRINRDTRFSKDKTPYKTNVGIQFRHEQGKDVHAPGFYVHLEPGQNFGGVGLWSPETAIAKLSGIDSINIFR
jgi:uncharacterized protein (TIGR02453 family)